MLFYIPTHWGGTKKEGHKMTTSEYREWMSNQNNVRNCEECPENRDFNSGINGNVLPCGQYNCWVAVACKGGR